MGDVLHHDLDHDLTAATHESGQRASQGKKWSDGGCSATVKPVTAGCGATLCVMLVCWCGAGVGVPQCAGMGAGVAVAVDVTAAVAMVAAVAVAVAVDVPVFDHTWNVNGADSGLDGACS